MPRRLAWFLVAASAPVFADGGTVLLHRQSPPFIVTAFESPTPPRVGFVDVSLLVQASETLEPVLDADVHLGFTKRGSQIQVQATREQSQNKLLYAASVHLDDPGEWHYTVSVHSGASASARVMISGVIAVAAEQPKLAAYWSYLVLPFLCLAFFAVHQWLRLGKRNIAQVTPPRR